MGERKLKIGLPKGSLQEHTLKVFELAGFDIKIPPKSYVVGFDDKEIEGFLLRPQEIPEYVEERKLDVGISGEDWIKETRAKVIEICDLKYAKQKVKKVKWVLAVPRDAKVKSIKDLKGKTISTEIINLAKDYLKKNKVKARIKFSFGATEIKPPRFADAIIDLIETGASLKVHNLKIIDTVFESSARLITNKISWEDNWKKEKIKNLAILLKGAVESENIFGLAMHVPKNKLRKILKTLPYLKNPTVTKINGTDFYDVVSAGREKEIRKILPRLKREGCEGIVEFPLNKVIY